MQATKMLLGFCFVFVLRCYLKIFCRALELHQMTDFEKEHVLNTKTMSGEKSWKS